MTTKKKIAFLFPGQGSQYPGMGKDFVEHYALARETFEEADDFLKQKLSDVILEGPQELLTQTKNSQIGIYVMSAAVLRVICKEFPQVVPQFCAGLSLGEYTALLAAHSFTFETGLHLVSHRGQYMNDACESFPGTMAVVLGLSSEEVENVVKELAMPHDLWAANFNCPGQVVISGTKNGIEQGSKLVLERGAKRVLPLQVHGAFHSGLMKEAEERLAPLIMEAALEKGRSKIVMNVPGALVDKVSSLKECLIKQVTHPVRWEQSIRYLGEQGVDLFIEIGCGKTLSGFNKRIGLTAPTVSVETVKDLEQLGSLLA